MTTCPHSLEFHLSRAYYLVRSPRHTVLIDLVATHIHTHTRANAGDQLAVTICKTMVVVSDIISGRERTADEMIQKEATTAVT